MKLYTLQQRASFYNQQYPHLLPLAVAQQDNRPFLHGFWFVGGGNVSSFYGSYQTGYLERIATLFPDCKGREETVHLFSGSLPASDDYTRVGIDPTGKYKSDFECDAHSLSSFLPFRPSLIYADPPYSVEDSEHYQNAMVNRARVVEECSLVLRPGGFIVWMDQALPVFSNDLIRHVGLISYVRSTGNRFRCVVIWQKPANVK